MKKSLVVSAVLVALVGTQAFAADMAVKAPILSPSAPVYSPVFSWTGFYIGGNAGWKEGLFNETVSTPAFASPYQPQGLKADSYYLGSTTANSFVGGVQLGYRFQTPSNWVFGVEGDFDGQNLRATTVQGGPGTATITLTGQGSRSGYFGTLLTGDSYSEQAQWQSSIRGTIGYAWNRFLVYATGGAAFTELTVNGNFPAFVNLDRVSYPGSTGSDSKLLFGGTVGGGVSYALSNNWEVGAEYRYTSYQGQTFSPGSIAGSCDRTGACVYVPVSKTLGFSTNEVLGKLSYRF
jgi:outer membrane immunogenic protein